MNKQNICSHLWKAVKYLLDSYWSNFQFLKGNQASNETEVKVKFAQLDQIIDMLVSFFLIIPLL